MKTVKEMDAILGKEIANARSKDPSFDVKLLAHDLLSDFYFQGRNPMQISEDELTSIGKKMSNHMKQVFGE